MQTMRIILPQFFKQQSTTNIGLFQCCVVSLLYCNFKRTRKYISLIVLLPTFATYLRVLDKVLDDFTVGTVLDILWVEGGGGVDNMSLPKT